MTGIPTERNDDLDLRVFLQRNEETDDGKPIESSGNHYVKRFRSGALRKTASRAYAPYRASVVRHPSECNRWSATATAVVVVNDQNGRRISGRAAATGARTVCEAERQRPLPGRAFPSDIMRQAKGGGGDPLLLAWW